jgi:large subunit ribosomal protein L24
MKTIQPRKQHKMLYQAPSHIRYKHFSAPLAPALKTSYRINSIPVRTGDTVRIMRGDRKGMEGKVTKINREKYQLFVEGVTREKVDGLAVQIPIHPSKVMVTNLHLEDKLRRDKLKIVEEKKEEKPVKEKEKPEKTKKERRKRKPRAPSSKKTEPPSEVKTEQSTEKNGENING